MPPFLSVVAILCIISNVNSFQRDQKYVERSNFQDLSPSHQPSSLWPPSEITHHATARPITQASRAASITLSLANNQQQIHDAASGGYPREPWSSSVKLDLLPSSTSSSSSSTSNNNNNSSHLSYHASEEYQPGHQLHPFQIQNKQLIRTHVVPPYQHADQQQQQHHQQAQPSQEAAYFSNLPSNLELALRQASGDESVFQPSPTIGVPGHSQPFDWLTQTPSPARLTATSRAPNGNATSLPGPTSRLPPTRQAATTSTAPTTSTTTSSTSTTSTTSSTTNTRTTNTEISNSVMSVPNPVEPLVLNHQNSFHAGHVHQKEYETNANNTNALVEFNNQVIYEGPATVPPSRHAILADHGDYYFSAKSGGGGGNNLNYNNEQANSNAWWAIGAGEEFERACNLTSENFLEYCDKSPLLINHKQRAICRTHPRVMPVVARAIKMAIDECQLRFAHSRWNCSVILQRAAASGGGGGGGDMERDELASNSLVGIGAGANGAPLPRQIFGDVMRHPNRERSFLNAIMAAALAHSMTRACSQGELPEECSCDRRIKSRANSKGRVEWVACSDDIDYGARFSRDFTDNFDSNELDTTMTIYMHNSEVGRRVFKSATDITCTCLDGGESGGFCQTKRCWKHLGSFADVVDEIMKRYEGATHVQRSNKDPHKLRPVRRGVRKPKRKDLVYIDESPDYCRQDLRIGVLGTQNRACNSTSHGPDNCSLLCCGRGFQTVVSHLEEECNCKFVWCCEVKCEKCRRFVTNDICN